MYSESFQDLYSKQVRYDSKGRAQCFSLYYIKINASKWIKVEITNGEKNHEFRMKRTSSYTLSYSSTIHYKAIIKRTMTRAANRIITRHTSGCNSNPEHTHRDGNGTGTSQVTLYATCRNKTTKKKRLRSHATTHHTKTIMLWLR